MPRLKRSTSGTPDSGFTIYDGPEPGVGAYRGVIKRATVRMSSNDNPYYNVLVEFKDNVDGKSQYDGYPSWTMITMTDKEANLRREKNFYRAIGVSEDPTLDYNEETGEIKKVGTKTGAQLLGLPVVVNMRMDDRGSIRGDEIFPSKVKTVSAKDIAEDEPGEDEDEELLESEDEETEEMSDEEAERRAELEALRLPALRKAAKDSEADITGISAKAEIIDAIIDAEFGAEAEDEDEEAEDEWEHTWEEFNSIRTLVKVKAAVLAAFPDDYSKEDLADMKKEDILQMLIEDEMVADPNPPF